ncbi:aldose epimerase family protein [Catenulispora pinisilvae]|uniref:aldose epimerase family protein n=1 Tax=Catenulispora pinisilvae TaxID=2705253 RepID=UPI001890FF48|nr:aldose epimerase family protein [Catenulispora pinisilvae]
MRSDSWRLNDTSGTQATILAYGATLKELSTADRDGRMANVVLGFDNLAAYREHGYFGCVVGRYANRIAGGAFTLDGRDHRLPLNDGPRPNTLHGGDPGFGARLWTAPDGVTEVDGGTSLTLTRVSPDGEEGFPGEVTVSIRYTLAAGRLRLDYRAQSTAPTVLNLSNHARFNLAGEGAGTVLDHELGIAADGYLPVDAALIPLDGAAPVDGTPFDFRKPAAVGARLADPHPQLTLVGGYDHCFVLRGGRTVEPRPVVELHDPGSGRTMRIATTEPGLQLYLSSELDGTLTGSGGRRYQRYGGIVLETQHFPDSPHRPDYPSTVLLPGQVFASTTILEFDNRRWE